MGPDGGGAPERRSRRGDRRGLRLFRDFQGKFKDAGVNQFGSGWAWLVLDGGGLAVVSTANQDNPISDGKTPLLGVDVWEHAYYLTTRTAAPTTWTPGGTRSTGTRVADRYASA